jgi:hypothetical protein
LCTEPSSVNVLKSIWDPNAYSGERMYKNIYKKIIFMMVVLKFAFFSAGVLYTTEGPEDDYS